MNHITTIVQEKKKEFDEHGVPCDCDKACTKRLIEPNDVKSFLDSFALALLEGVEESLPEEIDTEAPTVLMPEDPKTAADQAYNYYREQVLSLLQEAKKGILQEKDVTI